MIRFLVIRCFSRNKLLNSHTVRTRIENKTSKNKRYYHIGNCVDYGASSYTKFVSHILQTNEVIGVFETSIDDIEAVKNDGKT